MEKCPIWFLFFIVTSVLPHVRSLGLGCINTENCHCFESNDYTEYQCPPGNFDVAIKIKPKESLVLECEKLTYDLDKLPVINVENAEYLGISYCDKANFSEVSKKFNITDSVKKVVYKEPICCHNLTLTKSMFKGLGNLRHISVRYSFLTLDDDFLANTPNLKILQLPGNHNTKIGYNFNYTPQLSMLDLSSCNIHTLSNKVFSPLVNLQRLDLFNNGLQKLEKDIFTGLTQLSILDLGLNRIDNLPDGIFFDLANLQNLSLKFNHLGHLKEGVFRNNPALVNVQMRNNANLSVADYLFANKTYLREVSMDECNLKVLPEHLFEGSFSLVDLSLSNNQFTSLPEKVFADLKNLRKLVLSHNKIEFLPGQLFSTLMNLKELHLESNNLEVINENLFKFPSNLEVLNLGRNKIALVAPNAFSHLNKLVRIDLGYNRLSCIFNGEKDVCENLESIDLGSNLFREFPQHLLQMKAQLRKVNLANNSIDSIRISDFISTSAYRLEIDLSKNNLSSIDFKSALRLIESLNITDFDAYHYNSPDTIIILNENSIQCDCYLYDLVQYNHGLLNPILLTKFDIRQNNFLCANFDSPILVTDLKPSHLTCPVSDSLGCPRNCFCEWNPYDQSIIVNCSYSKFQDIPRIHPKGFDDVYFRRDFVFNQTVVDLRGNDLAVGPNEESGYENVTTLVLSHNQLSSVQWVPPYVKVLQLNHNNIKALDEEAIRILENATNLQQLTLFENPWVCDCSAAELQKFLMDNYETVDHNDVICLATKELLVDMKHLCQLPTSLIAAITIIFVFVSVFLTILAVYYRFEKQIKIYLFSKNLCMWFVTEEDLDKDKTYDIFLCFSHKDENFVVEKILPELEAGPRPFKVCIHVRDFTPGEFITKQIIDGVRDSRRTLIILSDHFLESVWCKMEFRFAHTQSMTDGLTRVIAVIYGDLNEELLDDEFKAYLQTNTYVKWDDKWFWEKLKYALPHSKRSFYNINKGYADVKNIENKFDFKESRISVHSEKKLKSSLVADGGFVNTIVEIIPLNR